MGLCCGASQARRDRSADYEERRKQELLEALGEGYNGELDFAESETASELPTPGRESFSGEETPNRSPSHSGTTSRSSRAIEEASRSSRYTEITPIGLGPGRGQCSSKCTSSKMYQYELLTPARNDIAGTLERM